MAIFYVLLGLSCLLCGFFIVMQNEKQPLMSLFLKGIASISVIMVAIYASFKTGLLTSSVGILFMIGLVFCLFGDVLLALLEFKNDNKYNIINMGSASFFAAHIFFSLAMINLMDSSLAVSMCSLFGLVMVFVIFLMQKPLKMDYNKSTTLTLIYTFGLSTALALSFAHMLTAGFSLFSIFLFVGFVLFFASDLVLSGIYFKEKTSRKLYYVNYALYYLAILFIAVSFIVF